MTNQLIIPFRGLDDNARPQSAALCYVYQSGTLTPVTVTDKDGTPLAWPVVADINGAWPQMFYAGALALKAVLKDADGVTLPGGTIDPVAVVTNVSTAAAIAFVPTDEVPETDLQTAVEALGVRATRTITAGTAVTVTNGDGVAGNPVIAVTTGALTQIAGLSLVEGDTLYRGASAMARLGKGAAGQVLRQNAAATAPEWGSGLSRGTSQATTSGTSIDFTGIPSWARRVTVVFSGVSTNGTDVILVQLGSTTVQTTGYAAGSGQLTTTAGIPIFSGGATTASHGAMTIYNVSGNVWTASASVANSTGSSTVSGSSGGTTTLSGALDRLRITTVSGTDVFDAGSVNVFWE